MGKIILALIIFGIIFALVSCSNPYTIPIPDWYLQPPSVESKTISSGFGKSRHKQMAIDMAVISAKRAAADSIASNIKGRAKYYLSEGTSQGTEIAVIESIDMRIENYERIKIEVKENGSYYEAYVLLSFPQQFNNEIFTEIERN